MPYSSVRELPAQVKKALGNSRKRMQAFLKAYNSANKAGKTEQECFRIAYSAAASVKTSEPFPLVAVLTDPVNVDDIILSEPEEEGEPYEAEIPLAPVNKTYHHPWYGDVVFDNARLNRFVRNFKANVLGIDIALDISHMPSEGAIGWFKDVYKKAESGLWGLVELTEEGYQLLKTRKYKYISPELMSLWKNPRTGEEYQDVILGAAVTNRPFLKDLDAILVFEDFTDSIEGGEEMELAELQKLLGLSEEATEEEVTKAIQALIAKQSEVPAPTEEEAKAKAFAEAYPEEATRLAELATQVHAQSIEKSIHRWTEDAAHGLPPTILEDVRALRLTMPEDVGAKFDAVLDTLTKDGLVPLTQKGSKQAPDVTEPSDGQTKFMARIEELVKEGKNYRDAIIQASEEMPEEAETYAADVKEVAGAVETE